jgi:hypothetical protein
MYDMIIYRAMTNPYFRVVRVSDGHVMVTLTGALAVDTSWATSFTTLSKDATIGGIPVKIPETLGPGTYDILFYDSASPLATDAVQFGRRFQWAGKMLSGVPIDI